MTHDPSRSRPRAHRPDVAAGSPTFEPAGEPSSEPSSEPGWDQGPPPPLPPRRRRFGYGLETVLLASTAALVAAVAWPIAVAGLQAPPDEPAAVATVPPTDAAAPLAVVPRADARIQIALLLDTSSSMDGLIDQARSQLWRVVNTLDSATYHGATPQLEIAVYEYGNDSVAVEQGHIRQVVGFTSELDRVSEALFGLTTMGGSEYAGQVIDRASADLEWSRSDSTMRVLYIAGNEEFTQGPVDYAEAIAKAKAQGVVVNTLNCVGGGQPDVGWSEAAALGGGRFFSIDHNVKEVYIAAPQDEEIADLGVALNETYVYYGSRGAAAFENQATQDNNALGATGSSNIQRQLSKASAHYSNPGWDLVDGLADGTVELAKVDRSTLPEGFRRLSESEIEEKLEAKKEKREGMRKRLVDLRAARTEYLASERAKRAADGETSLDDAILSTLAEQAEAAGFTLAATS